MASSSRLRGFAALVLAAAAVAAGAPQNATAAAGASDVAAVAAVNALLGPLPADDAVLSATFSPDHSHIVYRQAFDQPASTDYTENDGSDLWVIRTDGTSKTRLTNDIDWSSSATAPIGVTDAFWAPDSSGLAYSSYGPGHLEDVVTRTFTPVGGVDDWTGQQTYGNGGWVSSFAYTPDSRYLVFRLQDIYRSGVSTDYAVDRTTATQYLARTSQTSPTTQAVTSTWADQCATVTEGAYTLVPHPTDPVLEVVDALTGPNPACKFGLPADPTAPTGTTPTAGGGSHAGSSTDPSTTPAATTPSSTTPALNDSPGVTSATNPNLTPISERIPTLIVGPQLKIAAIGTGLAAALKSGVHVKFSLDRIAKVKVWVILTGSGARYSTDEAFAGVPATTLARASFNMAKSGIGSVYAKFDAEGKAKLAGASRITLQVKVTATDVAGRTATAVQNVKLRR